MSAERDAQRARIKSAFAMWRQLPHDERVEVLKAAKHGMRYGNDEAVEKGERFAQAFFERQELRKKGSRSPWLLIAMLAALVVVLSPAVRNLPSAAYVVIMASAVFAMIVIVIREFRMERQSKILRNVPAFEYRPVNDD